MDSIVLMLRFGSANGQEQLTKIPQRALDSLEAFGAAVTEATRLPAASKLAFSILMPNLSLQGTQELRLEDAVDLSSLRCVVVFRSTMDCRERGYSRPSTYMTSCQELTIATFIIACMVARTPRGANRWMTSHSPWSAPRAPQFHYLGESCCCACVRALQLWRRGHCEGHDPRAARRCTATGARLTRACRQRRSRGPRSGRAHFSSAGFGPSHGRRGRGGSARPPSPRAIPIVLHDGAAAVAASGGRGGASACPPVLPLNISRPPNQRRRGGGAHRGSRTHPPRGGPHNEPAAPAPVRGAFQR